jgi:UPF0755 protein
MSNLDLRFEDPAHRSRRRHRSGPPPKRKKKKKKKRGGGRSFAAFLIVLVLLAGLAGAGWLGVNWVRGQLTTPDYAGPGHGSVVIEVRAGQTAAQIATTLYESDVVKSPGAFVEAAMANPDSRNIQPGHYELPQQISGADAVLMLLDPANRQVSWVTIPEGLSKFRTYALLSDELDIPVEEFEEAEEAVVDELLPDWWFNRNDDREAAGSIEGFLFPDTYDFAPDVTAEAALSTMVNRFLTIAGDMDFAERVETERNISPYEALIAASLAQAEAGTDEDMGKVARVAYNRVYVQNMPLEMDVTVNYWLEVRGEDPIHSGQMTRSQLNDPDNPYSTHAHRGWMPGPINSPGQVALEGAMDPPEGNWLYFVAIDESTGESAFAATFAEHQANIRTACQNGVPLSEC